MGSTTTTTTTTWATTTTTTTTTTSTSTPTTTTTTTTTELIAPCLSEEECQDNAGCFADEVNFDQNTQEIKTICHCFLGFYLNSTNAEYPKTGSCIDRRTTACDDESEAHCYTDGHPFGFCPYCKAYQSEPSGDLSLGSYVKGEGDFLTGDPMLYEGGFATDCGIPATTEAYWYCWYDARDVIVGLDHIEILWIEESQDCHNIVYIYTPLACPWALP